MLSSLTVLMLFAAAPLAEPQFDQAPPLIDDAKLQEAGMFRYWQASLPLPLGDSPDKAHLVDEVLYVVTDGGVLFALTANTGLVRWAAKLTEADHRIYSPAHIRTADGAGPVVIPTSTKVFIHDRFTGDIIRSFAPESAVGSPAVGYDDVLLVGGADGRFYSLRLNHPLAREPFKLWAVEVDGRVTAAPVLYAHNMLLFASQGGMVYSCRAADKTLNWVFRANGPITGDPAVDESGVYVAGLDRSLYRLHLSSGRMLWRVRFPQPLDEGPIVTAHTVYQYCPGHGLSAIDADTGREKWRSDNARAFLAHTRNGDIVFTGDHRLEVVDHDSGHVRHSIEAPADTRTVSNRNDDAVYLLGRDGRVLCARLDSVPYLRRQQVIAARQQLNRPPRDEAEAAREAREAGDAGADTSLSDPLRSRRDVRP
ncbi:MAG: PQQ-like beta-propeller repeat protein [Phycisphaerales bacterium]|nr:MAG: PQQ-like beta-propeller repeat protein [Phycisphaerales bacterium]